ncbi:hypothetical protein EMIT0P100_110101 [Pseudomonas sp. IT-P100]
MLATAAQSNGDKSPHHRPAPTGAVFDVPKSVLGRYSLQSLGLARILRRLSVNRHFLRLPQ